MKKGMKAKVAMKAATAPAKKDEKKATQVKPIVPNAALLAKAGKIGAWGAAVEHAKSLKPKGDNAVNKLARRIYKQLRNPKTAGKAAKPAMKKAMKAKAAKK